MSGDADALQQLILDHFDVNSQTTVCKCTRTSVSWVENIIVNSTVQDGMTALHLAAIGGHTSSVQVLIEARADLNLKDKVPYNCGIDL